MSPKLSKKVAKMVNETEGQDFPLIPDGKYVGVLREVKVSEAPGESGSHYWMWFYEKADDTDDTEAVELNEEWTSGRLMNITSLSEKAAFKMKEAFDAHGVSADTDTDEIVGTKVLLMVGHRTVTKGARMGELTNSIEKVLPWDGEEGDDDSDSDDEF